MTTTARPHLDPLTAPVPGPGGAPAAVAGSTREGLALGDAFETSRGPTCGSDRARVMSRAETVAFSGGDALFLDRMADQAPTPVAATTDGGPLSAERVFREYLPRVYHLARRLLGHDADAEDVTQDVLVQVVRKLHT